MKKWFKVCPFCANEIKEKAIKCQYCWESLDRDKNLKQGKIKENNENVVSEADDKKVVDYFYSIDICIIVCSFAKLRNSNYDKETRAVVLIIVWLYWIFRLLAWIKVQKTWTTEAWRQRWKRKKIEWILIAVVWLSIWIILVNS